MKKDRKCFCSMKTIDPNVRLSLLPPGQLRADILLNMLACSVEPQMSGMWRGFSFPDEARHCSAIMRGHVSRIGRSHWSAQA
jgi:hypothetical protein